MEKEELLRQIVEIIRQDGEQKTDGECLDEVLELLEREEGVTLHPTDTDPTPAHGTPRPAVHPCAALDCDFFTSPPRLYCDRHNFLLLFSSPADFVDSWLSVTGDTSHPADRFARHIITEALNNLYGLFVAVRSGDFAGLGIIEKKTAPLFGFVACDTCGDLVESEELDVNGMCEHCRHEVENGEGVKCGGCGFTLSTSYACGCPADDQRTDPNA
jgi:hypothetical protein